MFSRVTLTGIRSKINGKLSEYLTEFPPMIFHKYNNNGNTLNLPKKIDWINAKNCINVNMNIKPVNWCKPGTLAGYQNVKQFCEKRLKIYTQKKNDPSTV